jgi:hypothetical protein
MVIPHRFKKIGLYNLMVCRIFSDILLALGLKKLRNSALDGTRRATLRGLLECYKQDSSARKAVRKRGFVCQEAVLY